MQLKSWDRPGKSCGRFFDGMIPCGIFEHGVTSIKDCIETDLSVYGLAQLVCKIFEVKFIDEYVEKESI